MAHGHPADGRDEAAVVGVSPAAGRDHYVGAQVGKAEAVARAHPSVRYDGELYRAVDTVWMQTHANHAHANHAQSDPGRYNLPGQSAVYTTPTMADLRAETANYEGLNGPDGRAQPFRGRPARRA